MFVVKRRSDGKFWRNRGYHQDSSWRSANRNENDPRWIDNPSDCVPFLTKHGPRNSRIPVPYSNELVTALAESKLPNGKTDWQAEHKIREELWYKGGKNSGRNKMFDSLYEVLPVNVVIHRGE